jgi:hypothetical protein
MPSFTVDFEVFCGSCGAGLCNQSDTRKSRNRGEDQLTVEPCEKCMNLSFEKGSDSRDDEITDLFNQLKDLQAELERLRD